MTVPDIHHYYYLKKTFTEAPQSKNASKIMVSKTHHLLKHPYL
jgi:hypothetical protein